MSNISVSPTDLPSDKKFGSFFCIIFVIATIWFVLVSSLVWSVIFGLLAGVFAVLALVIPTALQPLNRLWYGLGMLLGKIVSPIVLGIIFFVLISPVSLTTRLFGRDELRIKKRNVKSYWVDRMPPGPQPDSFINQY